MEKLKIFGQYSDLLEPHRYLGRRFLQGKVLNQLGLRDKRGTCLIQTWVSRWILWADEKESKRVSEIFTGHHHHCSIYVFTSTHCVDAQYVGASQLLFTAAFFFETLPRFSFSVTMPTLHLSWNPTCFFISADNFHLNSSGGLAIFQNVILLVQLDITIGTFNFLSKCQPIG